VAGDDQRYDSLSGEQASDADLDGEQTRLRHVRTRVAVVAVLRAELFK
jgi:hypothetical protein